jgi:hypothetical protein
MSSGTPTTDAAERVTTPAPGRACGSCSLCCKVYEVAVFDKPAGEWCLHCTPGQGCGIWRTRPDYCRDFHCLWMTDERMGPEWKPERSKFVVAFDRVSACMNVQVDVDHPDAWRDEPYHSQFRRWSEVLLQEFRTVLVNVGKTVTVVTPGGDVELGVMGPHDSVGFELRMTPEGPAFDVVKKQASAA